MYESWVRDVYVSSNLEPLTRFTSSRRSTEFNNIFPWNIPQMITKIVPIGTRIVISYAMKWGIPFWVWRKVNENWDNHIIRISQWRKSSCRTNNSIRRKKKSKRAGPWELQSGIQVGKLTIWVSSFKIITEFIRSISSTSIGSPVLMMDIKDSKEKHISRWVDQ